MKTTVSVYDFRDAFQRMGRGKQFSYEGLGVLFDYFEQLEDDCGMEIELDVVALCCDFAESTLEEIVRDYRIDIEGLSEDSIPEAVRCYLMDDGNFIGETDDGSIVYRQH
jgi:hypothetical protein